MGRSWEIIHIKTDHPQEAYRAMATTLRSCTVHHILQVKGLIKNYTSETMDCGKES